ncbi:hypothetical protein N0V93_002437 [Gnomoniopsis smithogilvyi]|uniref:Sugar phosphate transporter domain-containing protein n=1 Tax=Gnomoniopsis smithogilvyi TaxID=1191159 RepID=A0A9W8YUS2_9PEZI|nr:hypothetical protein N0V93_002437 [Gnomoniopsis smithogilvyi]
MTQAVRTGLHPAFYVVSWMFFSNSTIIFNKWLIGTAGFTIILTTIHLFATVLFTQVLARYTNLMPMPSRPVLTRRYIWYILSIGLCYTGSLLCSNMAYLTLSVSFISMLKALAPVTTLVISYAGGFSDPTPGKWAKIFVITFGVFLSSVGEVTFAWDGFLYQMFGTVSESVRLLLIDWLLAIPATVDSSMQESKRTDEAVQNVREQYSSGEGREPPTPDQETDKDEPVQDATRGDLEAQKGSEASGMAAISPLVLLYYYAPVCAVFNLLVALMTEWQTFNVEDLHRVGWSMLALNGAVAFMLNVSSVFLIGKTSALAMNLTGILKSVLLVFAAIVIWNTPITFLQAFGYGIALVGLFIYSLPDDIVRQSQTCEVILTHLGVFAVKLGNKMGLLGLGSNWGGRGGGGEGRYMSVPENEHEGEHEDSFSLDQVDGENAESGEKGTSEVKER